MVGERVSSHDMHPFLSHRGILSKTHRFSLGLCLRPDHAPLHRLSQSSSINVNIISHRGLCVHAAIYGEHTRALYSVFITEPTLRS